MLFPLSWFVVVGIVMIALSAFPKLKINQWSVSFWNLGWAFVLTGVAIWRI